MIPMIFDTHAHYDDEKFNEDRKEMIESLNANGIGLAVNVGANLKSSGTSIELAEKYPYIYAAAGEHPETACELNEENFKVLEKMALHEKVVAVGEIGLDYYWDTTDRETQKYWFIRQLKLAENVKKPVIIHSRDAAGDTLSIMKEQHAENIGGVIHCFSYSVEMAREYRKMGFFIGVGGVVTFKNSKKLAEVVFDTPLSEIVLETDCPYMAPVPFRGKRNSSIYLPYVADKIAEIKGITRDEVIETTMENGKHLYRIGL